MEKEEWDSRKIDLEAKSIMFLLDLMYKLLVNIHLCQLIRNRKSFSWNTPPQIVGFSLSVYFQLKLNSVLPYILLRQKLMGVYENVLMLYADMLHAEESFELV